MSTPRTGPPVFPGDPDWHPAGHPDYVPPCRYSSIFPPICGCGAKFDAIAELQEHVVEYNDAQRQRRHALDSAARGVSQ
jgi:hypothetical protein